MTDEFWTASEHGGEEYFAFLARLHKFLKPKTYMEIGTMGGHSLILAKCPSLAIDPEFEISTNIMEGKSTCFLAQMKSDRFFESYDPTTFLGGAVDMAFLDGMHVYEYLLRDFINTEKFCRKNSVILMHDCLPTDAHVARRQMSDQALASQSAHPRWWAGDVWKVLLILRQARPELRITAFDAPPTGVVAITNLDPQSDALSKHYLSLIDSVRNVTMKDIGEDKFRQMVNYISTSRAADAETTAQFFWL